jgi:hypothetical protein
MISENGEVVTKEMTLEDVRFSAEVISLIPENVTNNDLNEMSAIPNPMVSNSTIYFTTSQTENVMFVVYDQSGKVVYQNSYRTTPGKNQIMLNRQNLRSGLYFCKILDSQNSYNTLKLLIM